MPDVTAARYGHGIALLPDLQVIDDLRAGRLFRKRDAKQYTCRVGASLLVITGLDPVISRGTVLVQITGSSPVMTIGGQTN